jgi:hypothetical protein
MQKRVHTYRALVVQYQRTDRLFKKKGLIEICVKKENRLIEMDETCL